MRLEVGYKLLSLLNIYGEIIVIDKMKIENVWFGYTLFLSVKMQTHLSIKYSKLMLTFEPYKLCMNNKHKKT